jgi:nicotinamide-nucleotide amidase
MGPSGWSAAFSRIACRRYPLEVVSPAERPLRTAELLAVGAELTVGDTRDTNSTELARSLTEAGVEISRINVLPDRLRTVASTFRAALRRADLVISTGGLGPTPDDLTREAIALVAGEQPTIDPGLEAWLRELWARRDLPFPEINRKQAWLIPSARALANPNGTAPGWWVDRPDGRVVVLLPGPPREMRPMWFERVLPSLHQRGLGSGLVSRTLRLTGIGESQVADVLGEGLLRRRNPEVATYARAEAVDVRLSAVDRPGRSGRPGRSAEALLDDVEARVMAALGEHVWARGSTTWAEAIGAELDRLDWSLAARESGTDGALATLLGGLGRLVRLESLAAEERVGPPDIEAEAAHVARAAGATVGLAVSARPRGDDTAITIGLATPSGTTRERRLGFLGGSQGRSRAALLGAAALLRRLKASEPRPGPDG